MSDKTKQDLLLEKLAVQLEINKLQGERNVIAEELHGLFASAEEARSRKVRLDDESEKLKVRIDELQQSHAAFIEEMRLSLRFTEDMIREGNDALKKMNDELDARLVRLQEISDKQQALEVEIEERKKATATIVRDLNIYADRLTEAYKLNFPDRKVVIGMDIDSVNKKSNTTEEPEEQQEEEPVTRPDLPDIPGMDMSKIVI